MGAVGVACARPIRDVAISVGVARGKAGARTDLVAELTPGTEVAFARAIASRALVAQATVAVGTGEIAVRPIVSADAGGACSGGGIDRPIGLAVTHVVCGAVTAAACSQHPTVVDSHCTLTLAHATNKPERAGTPAVATSALGAHAVSVAGCNRCIWTSAKAAVCTVVPGIANSTIPGGV